MAWYDNDSFLSRGLSPYISTIIITALIALSLPILVHLFIYRPRAPKFPPTFLVLGPSGAGKTALVTLLGSGEVRPSHTSQTPTKVTTHLPSATRAGSRKYRSENDEEASAKTTLHFIDTPGHGKLRHHALEILSTPKSNPLAGIIFVVDAAALSTAEALTAAAEYLHDVLLNLQKRYTNAKTSKVGAQLPVLVAANKLDLFTALPAPLVKRELEKEITRVRETRARGLRPAGEEEEQEEEREWLGEGGDGEFKFAHMDEVNVNVDVKGGNVAGGDGSDVKAWWTWIADHL